MVQKLSWLLVVSVICYCQNSFGSKESPKEDVKAFGYELVQVQLDHIMNGQNQMSHELTQIKDTTMETSKIILERQNTLMERLIGGIMTIANNSNENKISSELAQIKDTVKISIEKQSSLMQKVLAIADNTNHILETSISQKIQEIESCKSAASTGVYRLICDHCPPDTRVYCEMGSFGGGWLVIQQRLDGSVNFTRNWQEYREGFGTVFKSTEFWLGLELIHQITNSGDYELAIELKNHNGKYGYARYSDFKIAGEDKKYRMSHQAGYSGSIRNSLLPHIYQKFSTFDQDNDTDDDINCSQYYHSGGGWWYKGCSSSQLNGAYTKNNKDLGIQWDGFTKAATFSRMMIRRK